MTISKIHLNYINCVKCLIIFCMIFPTVFTPIRLALLAICIYMSIREKRILQGSGFQILLLYLASNVFFLIWGLINNNPGAIREQSVDLLWPITFVIAFNGLNDNEKFWKINDALILGEYIICIMDIFFVLSQIGIIPKLGIVNAYSSILSSHYAKYGALFKYTTTHMCTHIFMIPYSVGIVVFDKQKLDRRMIVLLLLECTCLFFSGRVAFILTSLAAIPLSLVMKRVIYKGEKITLQNIIKSILVIIFICLMITLVVRIFHFDFSAIFNHVVEKFKASQDASDSLDGVRQIQKQALIEKWKESPIIGWGTGASLENVVRNDTYSWAYEYSYLALLFEKGLIGLIIYFGLMIWIVNKIIAKIKIKLLPSEIGGALILGLVAILIASAADPYLFKMGCMWMVFIPFQFASETDTYYLSEAL